MEEKKSEFNPTKYKNDFVRQNYDRFLVTVAKGRHDFLKKKADEAGMSLNTLVTTAIDEFLERHEL